MESLQHKVESWIRDQRTKIFKVTWPQQWHWPLVVRWPWTQGREHRKRIQEEVVRRKKQLQDLCYVLKAESVADLQEILCCMVLSECVYKRPASELVRAANIFKADFGGQVISLDRVQPSADHVPHRYLLAEAGDTLFASFVGTRQYKDVMADANIFQGAIFHEDVVEDTHGTEFSEHSSQQSNGENPMKLVEPMAKQTKSGPKPAAHRGFMARAKGIPALELYRLAQKKKRKLVLCGHSLGGAVAALATLAILRVFATSSKEHEKVQVKCITFSQPPVGNAALRDYVNTKGWKKYFKTYCIPEDLVPRILSPAYFHHYNSTQSVQTPDVGNPPLASKPGERLEKQKSEKEKDNEGEKLVLGLGPVQTSFWRLSRLVPLDSVRKQLFWYGRNKVDPIEKSSPVDSSLTSSIDGVSSPQSLEIQEDSDGISLRPLPETDDEMNGEVETGKSFGKSTVNNGNKRAWQKLPALPSYVPFGELYLLGNSSVESLSSSEYSKLTSVRSVIAEVKERFQSHSMRSYRSRFLRIYELCMNDNEPSFFGMDQVQQFPHLQKWLGISTAGTIQLGHIVETPVVHAATSIVPLGWSGVPCEKNVDTLKVDISGYGLHLCTMVRARVGGKWCSTMVESFPSPPSYTHNHGLQPEIQKMRIVVGPPLRHQPKHQMEENLVPMFPSLDSTSANFKLNLTVSALDDGKFIRPDDLSDFMILCTTDFSTVSKAVHIRTRRVRLIGLEGAGKTSLLNAILEQGRTVSRSNTDDLRLDVDVQEGIAGGLCYSDSSAVNLQNLMGEASRFRDELWKGIRDLSKKTDLIVLVHNLSHRVPRYKHLDSLREQPALSLLLDEAKSLEIPWVLGVTNKFSVSAHQQRAAIDGVLKSYQASPSTTSVMNSCPYIMSTGAPVSWEADEKDSNKDGPKKFIFAPINLAWRPFQKKPAILPVEGVTAFCQLIHDVLRKHEEAAFQELARDRLFVELAHARAILAQSNQDAQAKANSLTSAAVGASLGAGLGIVLAVVMGAASALRKP